MMRHDISCWPLVISIANGRPSLGDLRGHSAAWNDWLNRGGHFAVLRIFKDDDAYVHPPGGAKERKVWFSANGERLKDHVLGMATVAPPAVVYKTNKIKSDRLYGVPAQSFHTLEDAVDWLVAHLCTKFDDIDAISIKTRALKLSALATTEVQ